jgi:hypothetical protein
MAYRGWCVLLLGAALLPGCRRGSPHAAGSGYGVGLARHPLIVGGEPQSRGITNEGVTAPTEAEAEVGRVKAPPAKGWPQSGRFD